MTAIVAVHGSRDGLIPRPYQAALLEDKKFQYPNWIIGTGKRKSAKEKITLEALNLITYCVKEFPEWANIADESDMIPIHNFVAGTKKKGEEYHELFALSDWSKADYLGNTPLHYSMETTTPMSSFFLSLQNLDWNQKNLDGKTALHIAADTGSFSVHQVFSKQFLYVC
jgi:hypothetical protein